MNDYTDVRIFLCTTPTDMHYSFDRLMGRVQEVFGQDPLSGHLFLFLNRTRDRLKIQGQGHLFELSPDSPPPAAVPEAEASDEAIDVCGHRRHRKKREIDWDKLPQIHHKHDLQADEKICSDCGQQMDCIGDDVTRELELQPAKLEAHIHVRPKYACRCYKKGVCAAPLPQRPIPGGIAGPGLVSEVIVSKFGDHLPLYRLEDIIARAGVYMARSTLCDWVKYAAELFEPLYDLQRQRRAAIDRDVDGRHSHHGPGRVAGSG